MNWLPACCAGAVSLGVVALGAQSLQVPVYRSGVRLVLLPVAVTEEGRPVAGLTSADFEVLDNGVPQTVESSALEALPIDITLLVDMSGSVAGATLDRFTRELQDVAGGLPTPDRVRLIAFATSVRGVTGWHEAIPQFPNSPIPQPY